MNLPGQQNRLGLLLVLATITTYCVADGNLVLFALSAPAAVAAWFLSAPPLGRPMPRPVINLLLLGILAYTLHRVIRTGFDISTVCEIITLTLLVKLLDRRSQRDFGQVVSICAYLGIGTILTSNSFLVGIMLIVCLIILVLTTLVYQTSLAVTTRGELPRRPPAGRHAVRQLRNLAISMSIAGMIVSVIVFLLVPRRLGSGLFGTWGNPAAGQVTGFADEVELGTPGFITPSAMPVLDLQVFGPDGQPLGAPELVYYLRGAVLDVYDDGRWIRSPDAFERGLRHRINSALEPKIIGPSPIHWTIEQRITLRNVTQARSHLFAIWRPVAIQTLQPSVIYAATDTGTLLREGDGGKFEYIVRSRDFEPSRSFAREGQPAAVDPVTAENMDTARFIALAGQILTNAGIDPDAARRRPSQIERAAEAIARSFDVGFEYTLEADLVPPGIDPTEWFLFEHKAGHCEYYASAMALLCRAVGINARVITGYVATEFNEASSHYVVRQSNAHAWVEVETAPNVWKSYDPTPSADFMRLHEPSQSLLAQARRLFDAAEFLWIRNVVSFGAERQESLFRSAFNINWNPDRAVEDLVRRMRNRQPRQVIQLVAMTAIVSAVGFLVVFLSWRCRQSIGRALRSILRNWWLRILPKRDAQIIYRLFCRELARRGVPKPASVPLLTHVESNAHRLGREQALVAASLARVLYRARFDAPDSASLDECIRQWNLFSRSV